jgi:hypothetical protein
MMKRHRALSAFGLNVRKQREANGLLMRGTEKAHLRVQYGLFPLTTVLVSYGT